MALNPFKKKTPAAKAPKKDAEVQLAQDVSDALPAAASNSVLKRFFVSEKSARGQAFGHYTFQVSPNATKTAIKHAVQQTYKVTVAKVNIVRLPSKMRTVGKYRGTKAAIKKAIVILKPGQSISQAQP